MKSKSFNRYYLLSCLGVLIASYYPLSMGVRVITDMIVNGIVAKENYPKYIIPYTPISVAIILAVLLMPLFIRFFKRFAFAGGVVSAVGIFFALELLFEQKVVVSTAETVTSLENWQMSMCYIPPQGWGENVITYKTKTAIDILMGDYTPAFKLHFYVISVLLIVTFLNCLYGFGQMIKNGDRKRCKALVLQSICSVVFLGLCILACFTAFWRDGGLQVSALSATLMTIFFMLFGVTAGVFAGSFFLGKRYALSVLIPSISASIMTLLMYIGEMVLLNGHLYILGSGLLFEALPTVVFSPIDLLVILLSGCTTALLFSWLNNRDKGKKSRERLIVVLSIFSVVMATTVTLALCFSEGGDDYKLTSSVTYRTVQLLDKRSDSLESSYEVGTYLNGTDFSSMGQELASKIKREQKNYSTLTEEQRLASSHLWGFINIHNDTWDECEKAIGLTVNNPIESIGWLKKTNCFGTETIDTAKHVMISANSILEADGQVSNISITAGYGVEELKITMNATLIADSGNYLTGNTRNGCADYEEKTGTTSAGAPVLIVSTDEMNNDEHYQKNYCDSTAYWVNNNVFYTLRVMGNKADKKAIQTTLERILSEI